MGSGSGCLISAPFGVPNFRQAVFSNCTLVFPDMLLETVTSRVTSFGSSPSEELTEQSGCRTENDMSKIDKADLPKTFGVFSPAGHIVMGFTSDEAMRAARQALLDAGFNENAITPFSNQEVVSEIDTMSRMRTSCLCMREPDGWTSIWNSQIQVADSWLFMRRTSRSPLTRPISLESLG